jgi:hypothetical protein
MNFDDQQITERIQTFLSEGEISPFLSLLYFAFDVENLTDQAREFISSFPVALPHPSRVPLFLFPFPSTD